MSQARGSSESSIVVIPPESRSHSRTSPRVHPTSISTVRIHRPPSVEKETLAATAAAPDHHRQDRPSLHLPAVCTTWYANEPFKHVSRDTCRSQRPVRWSQANRKPGMASSHTLACLISVLRVHTPTFPIFSHPSAPRPIDREMPFSTSQTCTIHVTCEVAHLAICEPTGPVHTGTYANRKCTPLTSLPSGLTIHVRAQPHQQGHHITVHALPPSALCNRARQLRGFADLNLDGSAETPAGTMFLQSSPETFPLCSHQDLVLLSPTSSTGSQTIPGLA
ncbi:hypothetical protein V2G26_020870 [Clonostachys chloroleuca]